jgi:hypothetical protein
MGSAPTVEPLPVAAVVNKLRIAAVNNKLRRRSAAIHVWVSRIWNTSFNN